MTTPLSQPGANFPLSRRVHAAATPLIVPGARVLSIVTSTSSSVRISGDFDTFGLGARQVVVIPPDIAFRVQHPPGHRVAIGRMHERFVLDVLQWRYRAPSARLNLWQTLRESSSPYRTWRLDDEHHGELMTLLHDQREHTEEEFWSSLRDAVDLVCLLDDAGAFLPDAPMMPVPHTQMRAVLRREVAAATRIIETRYPEPLSAASIAEDVRMSVSALTRAFVKDLSLTPAEYLRRVRMAHFERLLIDTDMTITEAANAVGLSSTGHLRSYISAKYGMSARELRRAIHQAG